MEWVEEVVVFYFFFFFFTYSLSLSLSPFVSQSGAKMW